LCASNVVCIISDHNYFIASIDQEKATEGDVCGMPKGTSQAEAMLYSKSQAHSFSHCQVTLVSMHQAIS